MLFSSPGDDAAYIREKQAAYQETFGLHSVLLAGTGLTVSSSMVRAAVSKGEPIDDLVPPKVADYIKEHHLYQPTT